VAALLFPAAGCDEHAGAPAVSTSKEEADVKGVVKLRGKPVTNGRVNFHSANIRRATQDRSAPIGSDGTYAIKAYVGQNTVKADCKELMSSKNLRFRDFEKDVDVQSGTNQIDIDINPENIDTGATKGRRGR
jgi:hypothetical protein